MNIETVNTSNPLFPIFLKLENLQTLIVGGGYVGLEKLTAVLNNSPEASVKIVADEIRAEIREIANNNAKIVLVQRKFQEIDLQEQDLVLIATNDKEANKNIRILAKTQRLLVNVADTPDLCDFYLSSVVQKQSLKIAISTNGKSPTLAKRIKELLMDVLPDDLEVLASNLQAIRNKLKGDFEQKVKYLNDLTQKLVEK